MKIWTFFLPVVASCFVFPSLSAAQTTDPVLLSALSKKAVAGDASAMFELAMRYQSGRQVHQTVELGVQWLKNAAFAGSTRAMDRLGDMYYNGDGGVTQNYGEALKYYHCAADRGSAQGMQGLGDYFKGGHVVPKDLTQANAWYA